jgi:isopentenyl-diphosphate delta-isomerase
MAGPYLKAATISSDAVMDTIAELRREVRVTMFAAGAADIPALQQLELVQR